MSRYGRFKVVLLGDSSVGKSSLVTRFVKDTFDDFKESTIGAAFITKTIKLDSSTTITFEIWDTAGQERYKSLAPMYYRNANAAVVVFDLTDDTSFNKAISWINELKLQLDLKNGDNVLIRLVGNKADLKDKPSTNIVDDLKVQEFLEITKRQDGLNLEYIETSAKTGHNVFKIFEDIALELPLEVIDDGDDVDERRIGNGDGIDLTSVGKSVVESCNC